MKKFDYDECFLNHDGYAITRDGRKARLLCDDRKGKYPIVGIVGEDENIETFLEDGRHDEYTIRTEADLFTPSKRIKRACWVNIYKDSVLGNLYDTKKRADEFDNHDRLACVEVPIDCFEGEGLD